MTYRWVVSHIRNLPEDSRWVKHHRRESELIWDQSDHHRQDSVDLLQLAVYWLSIVAMKELKGSAQAKLIRDAPKRTKRPGEKQEKPQMTSKQQLREFFN